MATSLQPSTSPTDTRPTSDELKQSPPAFLDLADSVSPITHDLSALITQTFSDGKVGL
jgi:hypothetical protein